MKTTKKLYNFIQEKKTLVLLNKVDLDVKITKETLGKKTSKEVLLISVKENKGIKEFEKRIKRTFL
jgi:tRNA modification GTPase